MSLMEGNKHIHHSERILRKRVHTTLDLVIDVDEHTKEKQCTKLYNAGTERLCLLIKPFRRLLLPLSLFLKFPSVTGVYLHEAQDML